MCGMMCVRVGRARGLDVVSHSSSTAHLTPGVGSTPRLFVFSSVVDTTPVGRLLLWGFWRLVLGRSSPVSAAAVCVDVLLGAPPKTKVVLTAVRMRRRRALRRGVAR